MDWKTFREKNFKEFEAIEKELDREDENYIFPNKRDFDIDTAISNLRDIDTLMPEMARILEHLKTLLNIHHNI